MKQAKTERFKATHTERERGWEEGGGGGGERERGWEGGGGGGGEREREREKESVTRAGNRAEEEECQAAFHAGALVGIATAPTAMAQACTKTHSLHRPILGVRFQPNAQHNRN